MYISVIRNAVYIVSIRRVIGGAYNMCILVYNMCITNEYTCYTVLYNCVFPQCIVIVIVTSNMPELFFLILFVPLIFMCHRITDEHANNNNIQFPFYPSQLIFK